MLKSSGAVRCVVIFLAPIDGYCLTLYDGNMSKTPRRTGGRPKKPESELYERASFRFPRAMLSELDAIADERREESGGLDSPDRSEVARQAMRIGIMEMRKSKKAKKAR